MLGHRLAEALARLRQGHSVLRAPRAGQRRLDLGEVELDRVRVGRLLVGVVPQALRARVGLDELDLLGRPAGEGHVAQRLLVDREDRTGRAVLGRHVADRRPVGQRHVADAGAVELDELPDDAVPTQALGHGEHEVGGGGALGQRALQAEAEHVRDEHRQGLAQHRRLGLDAAHAPAQHAEAVDHRRVRVGADERVRVGDVVVVDEHHAGQVLEVDLVHDPGVGRHDLDAVERALAPAQEGVALAVALELELGIALEGGVRAEHVDLHRVVDHELGGDERVDLLGVAAEGGHGVAHRGEVDDGGHAGEVLHEHARGREGDLVGGLVGGHPGGERLDVLRAYADAVLGAQQVLEQDLEREGQPRDIEARLQGVEPIDHVLAPADAERGASVEGVLGHALDPRTRPLTLRRSRALNQA